RKERDTFYLENHKTKSLKEHGSNSNGTDSNRELDGGCARGLALSGLIGLECGREVRAVSDDTVSKVVEGRASTSRDSRAVGGGQGLCGLGLAVGRQFCEVKDESLGAGNELGLVSTGTALLEAGGRERRSRCSGCRRSGLGSSGGSNTDSGGGGGDNGGGAGDDVSGNGVSGGSVSGDSVGGDSRGGLDGSRVNGGSFLSRSDGGKGKDGGDDGLGEVHFVWGLLRWKQEG
ncbi:hypothetical protein BC829DRAFT_382425, partial [Chytridium lagenaria]